MRSFRRIREDLEVGNKLEDKEVMVALKRYRSAVKALSGMGSDFALAIRELRRRDIQLEDMARSRGLLQADAKWRVGIKGVKFGRLVTVDELLQEYEDHALVETYKPWVEGSGVGR